jgi:hypothetical protein
MAARTDIKDSTNQGGPDGSREGLCTGIRLEPGKATIRYGWPGSGDYTYQLPPGPPWGSWGPWDDAFASELVARPAQRRRRVDGTQLAPCSWRSDGSNQTSS